MSVAFEPYPTIDGDMLQKIGFTSSPLEFSYDESGKRSELHSEYAETSNVHRTTYQLSGTSWHPNTNGLNIRLQTNMLRPEFLFGPDGVAASDHAKIGLAVRWTDKMASVRGCELLGTLAAENAGHEWTVDAMAVWPSGKLRGLLSLAVIVYLAERGCPGAKERHLARMPGTVLGVLQQSDVIVDGSGSLFPVRHVSAPGEPLWFADCNWTDPMEDLFTDENFCISLNRDHRDYPALFPDETAQVTPLFKDIVSSAMQILLQKVLGDTNLRRDILGEEEVPTGTVAHMVRYVVNTFDLGNFLDSPDQLAVGLRKALEQRI